MANICDNTVEVRNATPEQIKSIQSIFKGIKDIKESYEEIPFYKELMEQVITDENTLTHKFGSKWIDIYDVEETDDEATYMYVSFTTAWSPTLGLSEMICKLFQGITIEHSYSEPGCDFGGKCIITHESYNDECLSYLDYLKKYDEEGFDNELVSVLEFSFDNYKQAMISSEEYSKYVDEINAIEEM